MDRFCFLGFLPKKKKRNKFLREIIEAKYPIIFYESCYRIIKTLKQLAEIDQTIEIFVGRELTKKFETLHQGEILSVIKEIETGKVKGEFVVIVKVTLSSNLNSSLTLNSVLEPPPVEVIVKLKTLVFCSI